jgi:hypothetical protein
MAEMNVAAGAEGDIDEVESASITSVSLTVFFTKFK